MRDLKTRYLNPLESSFYWAHKYPAGSSNWFYHQAKHAEFVREWRKTNPLRLA